MVRFPKAPDTFVTLHIQCVSCNELFVVAEDEANSTKQENWRTPKNGSGKTQLHKRPEHSHKLIRPLGRMDAEFTEDGWGEWQKHSETAVNCPRCGTDNRNWMRLAYAPNPGNQFEKLKETLNKSWLLWISLLVTGFLLLRLFFRSFEKGDSPILYVRDTQNWFVYALMIVIIILGTVIPIVSLPNQWRTVRIHKIISKYDKTRPFYKNISPILGQGIAYLILFIFVIPTLVYILLPMTTGFLQKETPLVERFDQALIDLDRENIETLQKTEPNELIPAQNAVASMQTLMPNNLFFCEPTAIDTTLANLRDVSSQNISAETAVRVDSAIFYFEKLQTQAQNGTCNPETVAQAILPLGELYSQSWQNCIDGNSTDPICSNPAVVTIIEYLQHKADPGALSLTALTDEIKYTLQEARIFALQTNNPQVIAQIESELSTIEKVIKRANDGRETLPGNASMLNTWLKYVGLSCLVAVITAVVATIIYESRISRHLPQPLCYSLSRLTRVVLWEARHTLEINGQFDRIEWNQALRNRNGGITLRGHLCPPTNGQPHGKYVRAMSYTLISDLWGHIIAAEARPIRVSPSILQAWEEHETQTKKTMDKLFIIKK